MENKQCPVQKQQQNMDIFDLAKFVMAFLVVAIHSSLFPSVLYPWLRMAVPLFFIISGYILFSRVEQTPEAGKSGCIIRYVQRNLKLYVVWCIILLPITLVLRRGWFANGVMSGIYYTVRSLLFGGIFSASWFLTASMTAVLLIYGMSQKLRMHWVLAVAAVSYFLCCMHSRYMWLAELCGLDSLLGGLEFLFGGIENSFFVALLWIAIGKAMAEKRTECSVKRLVIGLIFWAVVLYVEHIVSVQIFHGAESADCYFALVPFCTYLFALLKAFKNVSIPHAKTLRICSTLIYVIHGSFLYCVRIALKLLRISVPAWLIFLVTSIFLTLLSLLLIYLSRYPKLCKLKMLW